MSNDTLSLISTLIAERCIAADMAAAEARARYAAEPDCPRVVEQCVAAMMANIDALRAQNEWYAFIGQEAQRGNCC